MNVSETVIHHASDWIDWIDASGSLTSRPRVNNPLQLVFSKSPTDLTVISQKGRTRLWRGAQEALHLSVNGRASDAQLAYPATPTFILAGEVRDQQRRYNPRKFSITAGNAAGHSIELFRSPMGTRFASAGGLRGNVRFQDNSPASWAILSIEVTPLVGSKLKFRAQADLHGDFVLAMDRLPALAKDVAHKQYTAKLTALALKAASGQEITDPDTFASAQIQDPDPDPPPDDDDEPVFANSIDLTVSPGTVATLTSKDQPHLVLRIP